VKKYSNSDEVWFTLSGNVNSQNNVCGYYKSTCVFYEVFFYMTLKYSECLKVIGPMFFRGTNFDHYVRLTMILLFGNQLYLDELKGNYQCYTTRAELCVKNYFQKV
jgi:hypothetical protein